VDVIRCVFSPIMALPPPLVALNAIIPQIQADRLGGVPFSGTTLSNYLSPHGYLPATHKPPLILAGNDAIDKPVLVNAILVHLAHLYVNYNFPYRYDASRTQIPNATDAEKYTHLEYFFTRLHAALNDPAVDASSLVFYAIASKVDSR
jgi:hypothetical protein